MKKLVTHLTWVLITAAASTVNGQLKAEIGVKGGWNFASINTISPVVNGTKNSSGYHFGIYTLIKLSRIGIQPEVIFSQQGESYAYTGSNYGCETNYLNIPVMVKLYLVEGLNLQAGPQLGFLTKATGSLRDQSTGATATNQDVSDFLNATDFAIGIGAGWDLPFGLNLAARYNIGISDVNKYTAGTLPNNVTTAMGTSKSKNLVFQLSLGYRIVRLGN